MNKEELKEYNHLKEEFKKLSKLDDTNFWLEYNRYIWDILNENERLEQENKELKARFDKVIECIEKEYYSKNTTDINKVIGDREVAIYRMLKGE